MNKKKEGEYISDQHALYWSKASEDYMERLLAYAMRLANGRRYDAEALVQETVCRILMYPTNPEDIRSPLGYLLTTMRRIWNIKWHTEVTAKTESLDELLSKEAQKESHRSAEPTVEPDALRNLENDELRAEMRAIQDPLTSRERELLKLYLEGYTAKEIADKLNEDARVTRYDVNAVRSKVWRKIARGRSKGSRNLLQEIHKPPEIEGIYRDGKIELLEMPDDIPEDTHIIVTFSDWSYDLQVRGIDEAQAADLRARLGTFMEDWESPDMAIYDNYDALKSKL